MMNIDGDMCVFNPNFPISEPLSALCFFGKYMTTQS